MISWPVFMAKSLTLHQLFGSSCSGYLLTEHGHLATIMSSESTFCRPSGTPSPEPEDACEPFDLPSLFPLRQVSDAFEPFECQLEFGFQSQPLPVNRHNNDAFPFKAPTGQFKPVPTQTHCRAPLARAIMDDGSKGPGASGPDRRLHH